MLVNWTKKKPLQFVVESTDFKIKILINVTSI